MWRFGMLALALAALSGCLSCGEKPARPERQEEQMAATDEALLWAHDDGRWSVRVNPNLPADEAARYRAALAAIGSSDPMALGTALGPLFAEPPPDLLRP